MPRLLIKNSKNSVEVSHNGCMILNEVGVGPIHTLILGYCHILGFIANQNFVHTVLYSILVFSCGAHRDIYNIKIHTQEVELVLF